MNMDQGAWLTWLEHTTMKSKTKPRDQTPITFLHSEPCAVKVIDPPQGQGCAAENDTFIQGSGDSDTN